MRAHLLRTSAVITDVTLLLRPYLLDDALELVAQKRRGEHSELPPSMSERWAERLPALFSLLDAEFERSSLPEAPPNEAELEEWLVQRRLAVLAPKTE